MQPHSSWYTTRALLGPLLSIALSFFVISIFGAASIAKADTLLTSGNYKVSFATSSAQNAFNTIAEPPLTVLTSKDSLSRHAAPTVLTDVQTSDDLAAYAASLLRDDIHISSIAYSPQRVTMTYRSKETISGFGIRTVERTISITADGSVSVNRPWYTQGNGTTDAPESGFSDLILSRTATGLTPESEARLVARMQGRFVTGAL